MKSVCTSLRTIHRHLLTPARVWAQEIVLRSWKLRLCFLETFRREGRQDVGEFRPLSASGEHRSQIVQRLAEGDALGFQGSLQRREFALGSLQVDRPFGD